MTKIEYPIFKEKPGDFERIAKLHRETFGPGRFARTAFRIREGVTSDSRLCFVVLFEDELIASVRYYPILLGETPGHLLGPLTVKPNFKNLGIGKSLLRHSLNEARNLNEEIVLLVGDEPYYSEFGFERVSAGNLILPGPVDPERLLIAKLTKGGKSADEISGIVRGRNQSE